MTMFSDAMAYLADQLEANAGVQATLVRGFSQAPITIVSQGNGGQAQQPTLLADTPEESVYAIRSLGQHYTTFTVRVSSYAVDGVPVTPAAGDRIIIGDDQYVLNAPQGSDVWKYYPSPAEKVWYFLQAILDTTDQ